jgi:hypothetical protein
VISWIQTPGLWKLTLFRGKEADAARDTQVGETTDDNEPELSMTRFMRGGTSAAFALRARRPCFCGAAKADKITQLLHDWDSA